MAYPHRTLFRTLAIGPGEAAVTAQNREWFTYDGEAVAHELESDPVNGLTGAEAGIRLASHGPNSITAEPSPSTWQIALRQLADPMNVMLVAVAVISLFIDQVSVGLLVGVLVILNVVLGTRQEKKAQASVDALASMQIPHARVLRDGRICEVPAPDLVPGDIVHLEAGDLVPADGRILRAATLETQESSLTGESAPIAKEASPLSDPATALGDRTNMVFQNTDVTRGTAAFVVTDTGMSTEMGRIASMLSAVAPSKSPLQRELNGLTRVLGMIAWGAVAVIVVIGLLRGQPFGSVMLLGISMAISAIPTGLPTFVQGILSYGSSQLAEHKAIVKNLVDVETLGATSAINSDKTGTLTMNEMTVSSLYFRGEWFTVSGGGYAKTGEIRHAAGSRAPDFTLSRMACACAVTRPSLMPVSWGTRPKRRSWCLRRRWALMRNSRGGSTRGWPRSRSIPTTSSWRPSTMRPWAGSSICWVSSRAGLTWFWSAARMR